MRNHNWIGLRSTLVVSVGALVLLAVGIVAGVSYLSSRSIVGNLGSQLIIRNLDRLEGALRDHLDAAVYQAEFVSRSILAGKYGFTDRDRLVAFALGSMAAAPQIGRFVLADEDSNAIRVGRSLGGDAFQVQVDVSADPILSKIATTAKSRQGMFFFDPVYIADQKVSVVGICVPIRYENSYRGFVAIGISTKTLSRFADRLSEERRFTSFILYGADRVLAHPSLVNGSPRQSPENPLLGLHEIVDPVLEGLLTARPLREAGITLPEGSQALILNRGGKRYRIYTRSLDGYGDEPLGIGIHVEDSVFDTVFQTLRHQALVGIGLLVGGILFAIFLGQTISRPIRAAAESATAVRAFDFEGIQKLGRSRIREVDELSVSLNAAVEGLKSFGRYVPRTLVARLIQEGLAGAGSEERALSVMFTDIASFSAMCETMSSTEVAEFINDHLNLVASCIEREGGTIDKYIGDSVMAFWGAPDSIDNTAMPACRAALAIRSAIVEDNSMRAGRGLPPVRIRIGIHTGPLVVGDIGAPMRINYTVVGDVVNGGQRLETLGKTVDPEAETIILISRDTADLLTANFRLAAQGSFTVKGKERQLEVFRLDGIAP